MSDQVITEVVDRSLRVTFNRPEARNAMTFEMYQKLAEAERESPRTECPAVMNWNS